MNPLIPSNPNLTHNQHINNKNIIIKQLHEYNNLTRELSTHNFYKKKREYNSHYMSLGRSTSPPGGSYQNP